MIPTDTLPTAAHDNTSHSRKEDATDWYAKAQDCGKTTQVATCSNDGRAPASKPERCWYIELLYHVQPCTLPPWWIKTHCLTHLRWGTHQAWNRGVELNMRATPTKQNLRRVSTSRHQYIPGRNRLCETVEWSRRRRGAHKCTVVPSSSQPA